MSSNPQPLPMKQKRIRKRSLLPWLIGILFWGIFLLWYQYTPSQDTIEFFYSCGLYRANTLIFSLIQQTTTHSIALWFFPLSILLFLILGIANWIYVRKKQNKSHFWGIFWFVKWIFILSGFLLVSYLFLWGAGYQRKPIEEKLKLEMVNPEETEIRQIMEELLVIINSDNIPREQRDPEQSIQKISKSMQTIISEWDGVPIYLPARVRKTPPGLFLFNSTSGMCFPFTLEPHVDGALPPHAFVATSAHELAHIAGICGEAEASFVGYVSALNTDDPFARYSSALDIYERLASFLPGEERKKAIEQLPPEAQQDLKEEREIANKYRVKWFSEISWKAYDKYLKTQGVKEGVRDYGRVTNLLIAGLRKGIIKLPKLPENNFIDKERTISPQEEPIEQLEKTPEKSETDNPNI
ncbi:MAG: DUF3810 family protein [Candidatus Hydrogenedens sp.]